MTNADVGVVGAGIVGLSTAYALTELGATVRVYESGATGDGQSGGESRIFRYAHDDARLVALAHASRGIWAPWAERAGIGVRRRPQPFQAGSGRAPVSDQTPGNQ